MNPPDSPEEPDFAAEDDIVDDADNAAALRHADSLMGKYRKVESPQTAAAGAIAVPVLTEMLAPDLPDEVAAVDDAIPKLTEEIDATTLATAKPVPLTPLQAAIDAALDEARIKLDHASRSAFVLALSRRLKR